MHIMNQYILLYNQSFYSKFWLALAIYIFPCIFLAVVAYSVIWTCVYCKKCQRVWWKWVRLAVKFRHYKAPITHYTIPIHYTIELPYIYIESHPGTCRYSVAHQPDYTVCAWRTFWWQLWMSIVALCPVYMSGRGGLAFKSHAHSVPHHFVYTVGEEHGGGSCEWVYEHNWKLEPTWKLYQCWNSES